MGTVGNLLKSRWTVLNIEDTPAQAALVDGLLARRSEFRLLVAGTGGEGCEMARSFLPDVILMDIRLPDISGFDVLAILQADAATANIRVIALSADCYPHQIAKGLKAGFFRYLTKPYRLDDLMKAIDDALPQTASLKHPCEQLYKE